MRRSEKMEREEESGSRIRLQLHLYASKLPRVGILKSPPDTSALISFANEPQESSSIKGPVESTEIIRKSCHPHWTTVFTLDYEPGTTKYFNVYVMRHNSDEREKACYGRVEFEVSDVLKSKRTKARTFREGGCVYAHLHPVSDPCNMEKLFRFQVYARLLEVRTKHLKDIFHSAPDTLIEISKRQASPGGHTWITVYRSKPVLNNERPVWDVGELDLETCCNGDLYNPLRLSVWLHKQGAHETLLGMCETTVSSMMYACTQENISSESFPEDKTLFLRKPPSRTIRDVCDEKESGQLGVKLAQILSTSDANCTPDFVTVGENDISLDFSIPPPPPSPISSPPESARSWHSEKSAASLPTFSDYANDNCVLDLFTAIDFTSANGDPRVPGTLHHRSEGLSSSNEYEATIQAVGNAIEAVSSSRDFTVWGFGAKFGGTVRHIFQCGASSVVTGVDGMLNAYRSVFHSDLIMSSPSNAAKVIQAAAMKARELKKNDETRNRYCILLIVATGALQRIDEVKRKLIAYSEMPLSVVVVGVGDFDFKELQSLNEMPSGSRRNATFMQYREHSLEPASIGRIALENVQNQVVDYMMRNEIFPSSYG